MHVNPYLPTELWHEIFLYFDYKDLKPLFMVNKYFHYLLSPNTSLRTTNSPLDRKLFRDFPLPALHWKVDLKKVSAQWSISEWNKNPSAYDPNQWKIRLHPVFEDKFGNFILHKNTFHSGGRAEVSCYLREFVYPNYTETKTPNLLLAFGKDCFDSSVSGEEGEDGEVKKRVMKGFWLENATSPAVTELAVKSKLQLGATDCFQIVSITGGSKHLPVTVFDFLIARVLGLYRIHTSPQEMKVNIPNGGKWMLIDAVRSVLKDKKDQKFSKGQLEILGNWIDGRDLEQRLGLSKKKSEDVGHVETVLQKALLEAGRTLAVAVLLLALKRYWTILCRKGD